MYRSVAGTRCHQQQVEAEGLALALNSQTTGACFCLPAFFFFLFFFENPRRVVLPVSVRGGIMFFFLDQLMLRLDVCQMAAGSRIAST